MQFKVVSASISDMTPEHLCVSLSTGVPACVFHDGRVMEYVVTE